MSEFHIVDGSGNSYGAAVNKNNQLLTKSVSDPIQHNISFNNEDAYQVSGVVAITNSKQNILLVQNSSTTKLLVVTYIRLMSIGAAAASTSAFWTMEIGGKYSSGGTALTPRNVYVGSANTADGSFYDGNSSAIVTSGTFNEIDRNYEANSMQAYNKEGALILPRNQSLLITHTGSTVAGNAYARVSFYYEAP